MKTLTLILLKWRIWWSPNNVSKWQVGFNSTFKGLSNILQLILRNLFVSCIQLYSSKQLYENRHILLPHTVFIFNPRSLFKSNNLSINQNLKFYHINFILFTVTRILC
jgi:hypothetical protein